MGKLSAPPRRLGFTPRTLASAPDLERSPMLNRDTAPWRGWYKIKRWALLRMAVFVRDLFTCRMCGKLQGDTSQLVCDHRTPHRGDAALFWDIENCQTLCKSPCHDKHKQLLEASTRHQTGVWN